jgi:hypothetical protein
VVDGHFLKGGVRLAKPDATLANQSPVGGHDSEIIDRAFCGFTTP